MANGIPTADMSPQELAPTSQQHLQWPQWGQYYESSGSSGSPPELPLVQKLLELNKAWAMATDSAQRAQIWQQMLAICTDQIFTIGTVNGVLQPVVVSNQLYNVPKEGIYNWEPGAYFGIYRPDTFWFSEARRLAALPAQEESTQPSTETAAEMY